MSNCRAHYSSSLIGSYSKRNFYSKYILNSFDDKLHLDPHHINGQLIESIDLRYWNQIKTAINHLMEENVLIRYLNVSYNDEVNEEFLLHLLSHNLCHSLLEFHLQGCSWLQKNDFIILTRFDLITKLNLNEMSCLTDEVMIEIVQSLGLLTSLLISSCTLLTNQTLEAIAFNMGPQLIELQCNNNKNFNHQGIYPIILKAERLEILDISYCTSISFLGIVMKGMDGKEQFASRSIKSLKLDGCVHLQSLSLQWICTALPSLQEISLKGLPNVTDAMIQGLVQGCSDLISLNITNCLRITNITWKFITEQKLCSRFICLKMHNIGGIPAGLRPLEQLDPHIKKLSNDEQIKIVKENAALNSETIRNLLINCYYLEHLDISGNNYISDETFSLLTFPNDYNLITLPPPPPSSSSSSYGDELKTFTPLAAYGTKTSTPLQREKTKNIGPLALKYLNVSSCGLTSYGIACIGKHFPNLEELNISGLKSINDASLKVISGYCTYLRILKANDCEQLTDTSIIFLCQNSLFLKELYLSFTKITYDSRYGDGGGNTEYGNHLQYTDHCLYALLTTTTPLKHVSLCNQQNIKFSYKKLYEKFPKRGNYTIQELDLRGCINISSMYLSTILKHCYELNDVKLPGKFLFSETNNSSNSSHYNGGSTVGRTQCSTGGSTVGRTVGGNVNISSKQFWKQTFSKMNYVQKYSKTNIEKQKELLLKTSDMIIDTRKGGGNKKKKTYKLLSELECFHILQPHKKKHILQYRDQFYRRLLLESFSIRCIQKQFQLHRIWNKFRFRVMARRVAGTYKKVLLYRQWKQKIIHFTKNYAAKVIQKKYYLYFIIYKNAAKCIQRAYMKHRMILEAKKLTEKNLKAIKIQKIARGMLTRLSDTYILGQIYTKLPPFWREVMKIQPQKRRRDEKKIHSYEIKELHEETKSMIEHILSNVVKNGILAPKMKAIIPQPFDKRAYVSLSDGRKLSFYSDHQSLFRTDFLEKVKNDKNFLLSNDSIKYLAGSKQSIDDVIKYQNEQEEKKDKKLPMHLYNQRFWPLTRQPHVNDPSTEEHDPWLNNFEVIQNTRQSLSCEVCKTRLRIISCLTCLKGYCFFCSFRIHTSNAFKRNHQMLIIEPRIIKYKEVTSSLVYHIDMAQSITHDLSYLIKILRSATEVKRIQKERQLLKDYEKAEEKKRIAILKAREEAKEQHHAATCINNLYRSFKAKNQVKNRRLQKKLEESLTNTKSFNYSIFMIQRLFRMYSVRNWMKKQLGFNFFNTRYEKILKGKAYQNHLKLKNKMRKKNLKLDPIERSNRLEKEQFNRIFQTRELLISNLEKLKSNVESLLIANINYWLQQYKKNLPKIQNYEKQREDFYEKLKEAQKINASTKLGASTNQKERQEKNIKIFQLKYEAANNRLENVRNMNWWITQHLRSCYRRKSIIKIRFEDTLTRATWVMKEFSSLKRIEFHMNERLKKLNVTLEMKIPIKWVQRYLEFVKKQIIMLDSLQEVIIKDEITKLEEENRFIQMFDSLLEELIISISADNDFIGERIFLDTKLLLEPYGSELAIRYNEQLIELKQKQKLLIGTTIDTLKYGLQLKYDEEEDFNVNLYGFPNDDPDLKADELYQISAVIIEPFISTRHVQLNDFLKVYLVQPWLAEESVEDVRLEELITSKQLEIGGLREELQSLKNQQQFNDKTKKQKERRLKEVLNDIEVNLEGFDGEAAEEIKEREERLAILRKEEGEINLYLLQYPTIQQNLADQQPALLTQIDQVQESIEKIRTRLRERIKERERSSDNFFETERELMENLIEIAQKELNNAEVQLEATERDIHRCDTYSSNDIALLDLINDQSDISLDERKSINIPKNNRHHKLQGILHQCHPRVTATPKTEVQIIIETRACLLKANQSYFLFQRLLFDQEVRELSSFLTKRQFYQDSLSAFRHVMITNRRKRAIQLDLEQRKARVNRMRSIRLNSMLQAKEEQIIKDRIAAEAKAKQQRERISTNAQIATLAKKTIRNTKDAIRDLRHKVATEMDEEEKRMAANIREKNKDSGVGARPEGIRAIQFTSGINETEAFQRQNDHLRSKGLPHFVKMERSLGNSLFLWTQSTFNSTEFITSIYLGHKDHTNENYINLYKNKYFMISHDEHDLQLWLKNDKKKSKGIKNFQITFTEAEETRLLIDGYEKLEPNLLNFNLPDTFLWVLKVEKIKIIEKKNRYTLQAELNKLNKMIETSPNDQNLLNLKNRLQSDLEIELIKYRKLKKLDPIEVAIQQMALEENELLKIKKIFHSLIDTNKTGKVTLSQIFEFLEETPIAVNREVFLSFEAMDEEGFINFGSLMKVLSTFGMFGKHEILRFIFSFIDRDRYGFMTREQFTELLVGMHPYDRKRTNRALKLMHLDKDIKIYFEDFTKINEKYPQLFHPIFALQDSMRNKIMGTEWWFNKLSKYKGVRDKMALEGKNTDEMVELELERFKADEEKEKRMIEREKAIKQETSEIRKTLLQARQFIDEFS